VATSVADQGLHVICRLRARTEPSGSVGRVGQDVPMASVPMASVPMVNLIVAGFVSIVAGGLFLGALNAHRGRK